MVPRLAPGRAASIEAAPDDAEAGE
jgi:hypothetical protein